MAGLKLRHPTKDDIEAYVGVWNSCRASLPQERAVTLEELRAEVFEDEDYDPAGCWLVETNGKAVAIARAALDSKRLEYGISDGQLSFEILPNWRGKGIEDQLMNRLLDYLRSKKIKYAQHYCYESETWKMDLARTHGFEDVRHFFRMVREGKKPPRKPKLREGIALRHVMFEDTSKSDIRCFVTTFNDTFSEHFSFSPASVSKWLRLQRVYEDVGRTTFAMQGRSVVGICFCEESVLYNRERGTKSGWVWVLGVKKSLRKKGIGRALLADAVDWLTKRGMDTVYLALDAENRKALALYTSLGFEVVQESVMYRLEL